MKLSTVSSRLGLVSASKTAGPGPERRIGRDPLLRQGEVEVLRVHLLRLDVNLRDPLAKGQTRVGIDDHALSVEVIGEHVEHPGVLVHHRVDHLFGIEDLINGEESECLKVIELFGGQGRHSGSPASSFAS